MKKTNYLWAVLCAAMLFGGCKEEEQTVLSLENLPTTTISGYLTYDAGYADNGNGTFVRRNEAPAAGQRVFAMVEYSEYQSNATGTKVYEGTTDETGKYTLQIYTTTGGVAVKVQPAPFEASFGKLVEADGKQELKTVTYHYKVNTPITFADTETLPNIVSVKETPSVYTGGEVEGATTFPYSVVVSGTLKVPVEDTNGSITYVGQVGRQVKVWFTRESGQPESEAVMVATGTVNGMQGEYTVNLPIDDLSDTYYITAEAMPFAGTYSDYTSGNPMPEVKNGIYTSVSSVTATFSPNGFNGRTVNIGEIKMQFTANE